MKRTLTILAATALLFCSCKEDAFKYETTSKTGILSLDGFTVTTDDGVNIISRATTEASGDYVISLSKADGSAVWEKTYSTVLQEIAASKEGGISLEAGDYEMTVQSISGNVPAATFSTPVYGTSTTFTIETGKTTSVGTLTCKLLQCAVKVRYNDDFLGMVTGDGTCAVEVTAGEPLSYALSYNNGAPSYDESTGYFAVNNGSNTTMAVTFRGSIEGKAQKMKTSITGIKAQDLHIITFMKKIDETGNASFVIVIDGLVADTELVNDIQGMEEGDGNDPNAPAGDGGIQLVSTCDYDITQPVTIPAEGDFVLTMQAIVPNGTRKFTVDIASTNDDFIASVNSVGGTTLDLINPSEAALGIFTIVPFPHGEELLDATVIDFDLTEARDALLAFPGTHTFTMNVTDNKGCKNSIVINLVVL
ncbi:MAG: DUF4493 domain-containing protein [Candidatus Cryptobacteroides sp.]